MKRYSEIKREKRIKLFKKILLAIFIISGVILAGILTAVILKNIPKTMPAIKSEIKPIANEDSEVSLVMVGDNLLHIPVIRNGEQEDGTYSFDSLYEAMKPYFKNADISVIVQETILGGKELGYSGYPLFNSPQAVGDAIINAGFDIVLHATNHALDKGSKGVENTIEYWKKHPDVTVLGINESHQEQDQITYYEKNGIKLALLNYTDSTNGIPLPQNKKYIVNTVNEEKIIKDLTIAENNADFTIVFMHWGVEYHFSESQAQTDLATMMCENGADLIMGSHPHVIQPVKWVNTENGNKAMVFYSLGNYVSRQKEANNLLGIMAEVKIYKNSDGKTFIKEAGVMPTVTHYNVNSRGFKVYPLKDYTDELASTHGVAQYDGKVSVERFKNTFEKVFSENTAVKLNY